MSYFDQIAPMLAAQAFRPQTYNPWGGVSMLPKSQSNFGAAAPAIATNRLPIDTMNAVTNAAGTLGDTQYKGALVNQLGIQNQIALMNLGIERQYLNGDDMTPSGGYGGYSPGPGGGTPGVPAAPTGAGVGSPAPKATPASSGNASGWGSYADPAIQVFKQAGWSDAAIQGAMANGMAEGGFATPWKQSGVVNAQGQREQSYGHWQFNENGELPGYEGFVGANGNPEDTATQARYLVKRMAEIAPDYAKISDPKAATDLFETKFERPAHAAPGQRYLQLAAVQRNMAKAPGPQYAQANTGTDATPDTGSQVALPDGTVPGAVGVGPPPNGAVPGVTSNRAQGRPTQNALDLMRNGPPMPTAPTGVSNGVITPAAAPAAPATGAQNAPAAPPVAQMASAPPAAPPAAPAMPPQTAAMPPVPPGGQNAPAMAPGGAAQQPYMPYTPQQIQNAVRQARLLTFLGKPLTPELQQIMSFAPGGANDPRAIAAKAAAQAQVENQIKLQYAPQIARQEAIAKAPYTGVRPGSPYPILDQNGNYTGRWNVAPQLKVWDEKAGGFVDPNTGEFTPVTGPYQQGVAATSTSQATGPATFKPTEVHGPFGNEYTTTERNLAGTLAAPVQPNTVGGGYATGMPGVGTPAGAPPAPAAAPGAPAPAAPQQSPFAAAPTFPVQTANGQKDISQVSIGDMFPGGQGIPMPPAPPPGATYGQPGEATKKVQEDDATRLEGYGKEASENQKIYQDLAHLQGILQNGLKTGAIAPKMAELANWAQSVGLGGIVPKQFDPNDAAVYDKATTDLVFAAVKKLAGVVKVAEITGYQKANPSLVMPVAANMNVINDVLSQGKWQDARAKLASQYFTQTGGAPLAAFDAKFNQMAPLADVTEAIKNTIKAMPQYKAGLANGIGFPEDVGKPTQASQGGSGTLANGQIAIGPGGHRIQNQNGTLIDLQTGKPFVAPK